MQIVQQMLQHYCYIYLFHLYIYCRDEIDKTAGARKMTKKTFEHLEKLNTDCNKTAGLYRSQVVPCSRCTSHATS